MSPVNPNHYIPRGFMAPPRLQGLCEEITRLVACHALTTRQIKERLPDTDPSDVEEAVRVLKRHGYIYKAGQVYSHETGLLSVYEATTRRGW